MSTLKDNLPGEFMGGEYLNTKAYEFRDVEVTKEHRIVDEAGWWIPWPGPHRNVMHWYELANGYSVGFNENPARGWSFPVVKTPKPNPLGEQHRQINAMREVEMESARKYVEDMRRQAEAEKKPDGTLSLPLWSHRGFSISPMLLEYLLDAAENDYY